MFLLALRMTHDESLAKIVLMNDSSKLANFRICHSQKLRKKTENTDHQRTLLMTNTDCSGNRGRIGGQRTVTVGGPGIHEPLDFCLIFACLFFDVVFGMSRGMWSADPCFDRSKLLFWTV